MSYFDGGRGREAWAPDERCPLSPHCALRGGHGGGCDPRKEAERFIARRWVQMARGRKAVG